MRSRFLLTVSVSALLAGLGLTACGSGTTTNPPKAGGTAPASVAPVSVAPVANRSAAPAPAPSTAGTTGSTAPGSPRTAACRPQELRWTLTRLTAEGTDEKDPANAELVATDSGSRSCTLTGYPKLEFHLGKGPEADGVGKGNPAPVTLGAGGRAVIALRFSEMNGKGPDSDNCNPQVTAGAAEVTAPGGGTAVRVPVTDRNGKPAEVTVCGDEVRMSPPVAR